MKLIIITRPGFFPEEATLLTSLFRNGLQTLHLRKPQASVADIRRLLQAVPPDCHPRIVLHDHFSLTQEFPLKGIHLNRRNPLPPQGYEGSVSRSCHSLPEVEAFKSRCDYLFLSPVFNSISKQGYQAAFTEKELKQAAEAGIIDDKVMALGGIEAGCLPQLKGWHFGGAAFLGDIWKHNTPAALIAHFLQLKALCDNLK